MHGRLKVKTSEEQAERRRVEQQKKLEIYRGAVSRIFDKRTRNELDDEMLMLTGQVLSKNPDFYSLWNVRRELISDWINTRPQEVVAKLLKSELEFLEHCITVNPKSYGSWHHRGWTVGVMLVPDWQREIQLCTRFLERDERNFHCWDYRRFAVSRAGVAPEQEFKFTTDKISDNFSNFSSWHYRSKLLPLVYPANPSDSGTSLGGGEGDKSEGGVLDGFNGENTNVNNSSTPAQLAESDNSIAAEGMVAATSTATETAGTATETAATATETAATATEAAAAAGLAMSSGESSCGRVLRGAGLPNYHSIQVRQDILMQELDLVENAYFTDPNDQSAWFYHRWLLGRVEKEQRINFALISPSDGRIVVSLERPVRVSRTHDLDLLIGAEAVRNLTWSAPSRSHCDAIWTTVLEDGDRQKLLSTSTVDVCVRLYCRTGDKLAQPPTLCDEVQLRVESTASESEDKCVHWMRKHGARGSLFSRDLGAATTATLEKQLDSCRQLHDLEPDNKWVLLTLLSLMRAVDPATHLTDTLVYLDTLISVDPTRLTYYLDLRSRFVMENNIEEWLELNSDAASSVAAHSFALPSSGLTAAYHLTRLCAARCIDLSGNSLRRLSGAHALQCVRTLNLSHNKINTCRGLENLPYLRDLDLSHNELEDPAEMRSLGSCTSLTQLHLVGNPVVNRLNTANTLSDDTLHQVIKQLSAL